MLEFEVYEEVSEELARGNGIWNNYLAGFTEESWSG